ncbi:hypothetical protein KAR91_03500 [Candidatus Pacearchaeota archaeon]|nr:hypothetical protein [Candidatus Pacearchaeota archaeon]
MPKLIHCPTHAKEILHRLKYWSGKENGNVMTDWWLCKKCGKPFKIKYEVSTLEGDVI